MDPAYVQRASARSNSQGARFTRLASQRTTPGRLAQFFEEQAVEQPMPSGPERLESGDTNEISDLHKSSLVSAMARTETAPAEFTTSVASKQALFLTPMMRAWGVPLEWVEQRETNLALMR